MKIIGTLKAEQPDGGKYTMLVRGLPIPCKGELDDYLGKHVVVHGMPMWCRDEGSYLEVTSCKETTEPDYNLVHVRGVVRAIFPEQVNPRGRRSACILLQRGKDPFATTYVTALSDNVDAMNLYHLEIGDVVDIEGYIATHSQGLHVLFRGYREEGPKDA